MVAVVESVVLVAWSLKIEKVSGLVGEVLPSPYSVPSKYAYNSTLQFDCSRTGTYIYRLRRDHTQNAEYSKKDDYYCYT